MPPRARRDKRSIALALTAPRMLALTVGPDPGPRARTESDEVLARLWSEHRERILADYSPGTRPWAYWYFEPDVPEELREERPVLRPVDEGDPSAIRAEREHLEAARREWLVEQELQDIENIIGA